MNRLFEFAIPDRLRVYPREEYAGNGWFYLTNVGSDLVYRLHDNGDRDTSQDALDFLYRLREKFTGQPEAQSIVDGAIATYTKSRG